MPTRNIILERLQRAAALVIAILATLGCCSCELFSGGNDAASQDLIPVCTEKDWPPADSVAPAGFTIPPDDAYRIAAKSNQLSYKRRWTCYRDDKYYYIVDGSSGKAATAQAAYRQGIRINGTTGAVEPRAE